jgi:hypothetical protein
MGTALPDELDDELLEEIYATESDPEEDDDDLDEDDDEGEAGDDEEMDHP